MDVVPRGTELELQLRRGVRRPHKFAIISTSRVQKFIRHKQWKAVTTELYWVLLPGSWIPSLALIIQLRTKLLVTVRAT